MNDIENTHFIKCKKTSSSELYECIVCGHLINKYNINVDRCPNCERLVWRSYV